MKRLIIATALFAGALSILTTPASAQRKPYSAMSDDEKAHAKVAESVDRQYRATLDKTAKGGAEVSVDPWAIVRGTGNSKPKR